MKTSLSHSNRSARLASVLKGACFALLVAVAVPSSVMADGKVFTGAGQGGPSSAEIPFQRALIAFAEGEQTLVLQSHYTVPVDDGSVAPTLGWVVPVPAMPELASIPAEDAEALFRTLGILSRPVTIRISQALQVYGGLLIFGVSLFFLVCAGAAKFIGKPAYSPQTQKRFFSLGAIGMGLTVINMLLLPMVARSAVDCSAGVEVLDVKDVGVYSVEVVRAETAADLIAWLRQYDLAYTSDDEAVFNAYIRRDWKFVVARLGAGYDVTDAEVVSRGMTAPLVVRFSCEAPVYPLALTATGGHATELLLYLFTDGAISGYAPLERTFAGFMPERLREVIRLSVVPNDFLAENAFPRYVTRLRGRLTSFEMTEDMVFRVDAGEQSVIRERRFVW